MVSHVEERVARVAAFVQSSQDQAVSRAQRVEHDEFTAGSRDTGYGAENKRQGYRM